MEPLQDSPLLGEPTLPPREGLNKPLIYGLLGGLGVGIFVLLVWAVHVWISPAPPPPPPVVEPKAVALQTPPPPLDGFMRDAYPTSFANLDRRPAMPEAQLVQDIPPPPIEKKAPPPEQKLPPPNGTKPAEDKAPTKQPPSQQGGKPKKPVWGFLATGTAGSKPPATPEASPQAQGAQLIDPAVWAIPAKPERTLYRTQVLPCEVLQLIDSDAPGQIQLGLTVPVFGFYGQGEELFPKGSKVVALPGEKPDYGAKTLKVKLDQVQLPNGTVVVIPGELGNEDGSNQLKGQVNNHWGTTVAAAALNALINLGGGYVTGTPGRGQFYQDPPQRAMQEAAQSAQQDAHAIVTRELKRGPTITRDPHRKGERFCTIQMTKNIQFSARPWVVK